MGHMRGSGAYVQFPDAPQTRVCTEVFHDAMVVTAGLPIGCTAMCGTFGRVALIGSSTVPPAVI